MSRIQKLISRETSAPILISFLVLTFVVFTREFGRLAELLINTSAGAVVFLQVVGYLMPSILIFTVPFSFLIGTLIAFSRLSTDSEIVALRAGGVSVGQMLKPVLKTGLLVMILTAVMTLFLLPSGNWQLRQLRHQMRALPVQVQIKPRVFYEDFPGMVLYVEDIDPASRQWSGIFLSDTNTEGERRLILASRGHPIFSSETTRFQLHFEEGTIYKAPLQFAERDNLSEFETLDIPVDLPQAEEVVEKPKRPVDKDLDELLTDLRQGPPEEAHTSEVELHRRLALPLSAILFAILGVTLGIRTHRGGRGYGFVVSILVAFSYYVAFATGSTLSENGVLPIFVGVWGANLLGLLTALITLKAATKESTLMHLFANSKPIVRLLRWKTRAYGWLKDSATRLFSRERKSSWNFPRLSLSLARVVDLFMARIFLLYLFLTLAICVSLFYLFTFFELIDDVFANQVTFALLLDYFRYLLPHILILLIPISVLIATLITFGSLDRTQQVVAFKSCGVSVYRIALPVFMLASFISIFLFVTQEYVLPYANQRQDTLRNIIKGRPVQTSQPGNQWIFGGGDRLFNYDHFNSERNVLVGLSALSLDISEGELFSHVYAQRAVWDREAQRWRLVNGWERDFLNQNYEPFEQRHYSFPEDPGYFGEEVQASNKMSYMELSHYIADLQQGGFEVDSLKTELYKKGSFPLVSLIMTIIGVPFALSMGRRGALYGIAAGVLIGILYWGTFGVFDVLGSNGLLAPALAAWGPNILFGAGAVLLLSTIRT